MTTILEALQGAEYNLRRHLKYRASPTIILLQTAKEQIQNAGVLLEKGYGIYEDIEVLIDKHGTIEEVPELGEED